MQIEAMETPLHQLSLLEKTLIVRAHDYLTKEKVQKRNISIQPVRDQVANCLGTDVYRPVLNTKITRRNRVWAGDGWASDC